MSDPQDYFHPPVITEGYAIDIYPVRWKPYKPGARTNKKGRWQKMNEYGGWDNCERPVRIFANFPKHLVEDDG